MVKIVAQTIESQRMSALFEFFVGIGEEGIGPEGEFYQNRTRWSGSKQKGV